MGKGFGKPAHRKAHLNGQKAFEKIKSFTSNPGNQNSEILFHTSYLLGKMYGNTTYQELLYSAGGDINQFSQFREQVDTI